MPQALFTFEQALVDAELAQIAARVQAREAAKAQRAIAKRQAEIEKSTRRVMREAAYRRKHPPGHAQCGIRWTTCREAASSFRAPISWRAWEANPAGSGWTHCHACGQALIYTTDPNAKPQQCKGRK